MNGRTQSGLKRWHPRYLWAVVLWATIAPLCSSIQLAAADRPAGYFIAQTPWQPVILESGAESVPLASATIVRLGPGGRFSLLEVFLVRDAEGRPHFEKGEVPWVSRGTFVQGAEGLSVTLHNVTVNGDELIPDEQTTRTVPAGWLPGQLEFEGEPFVELCDPSLRAEAEAWFTLAEHLDRLAGR